MRLKKILIFLFIMVSLLPAVYGKEKEESAIIVTAAATLENVLVDLNPEFTKQTGIKVYAQYMCSAMVLSSVILTKEADVFFPGSEYYMNEAIAKHVVVTDTIGRAGYMVPVITVPKGNPKNIRTIEDFTRPGIKLGFGEYETVSSGRLAEAVLRGLGIFEPVQKNVVLLAASASKLQIAVSLGNVDAGINALSECIKFASTTDYYPIPPEKLKYCLSTVGMTSYSKHQQWARKYIQFITSPAGRKFFDNQGFALPPGAEKAEKIL